MLENKAFDKGDEITFLDYQIKYCTNGDGIVLYKERKRPRYKDYECHLGNYNSLESAQKYAVLFYMIARPERFATHIIHFITGTGTMGEFYALKKSLEKDGIAMPDEITCIDAMDNLIAVNGKTLYISRKNLDVLIAENKQLKNRIGEMKRVLNDAIKTFSTWMEKTLS